MASADDILSEYKRTSPDVVLCDVLFDSTTANAKTGLDAMEEIIEFDNDARIVIYSQFESPSNMQKAYKMGAKAFLTKNASPDDIELAIKEAANHKTYFCDKVARALAAISIKEEKSDVSPVDVLSERELNIFIQMAMGETQEQISQKTGLHHRTITGEIKKIKDKLGVKKPALLTLLAVKYKLIDIEKVMGNE